MLLRYCVGVALLMSSGSVCVCFLQGYTLAEEEEDSLIYQHRQQRSNQGDMLVSGPVETGPMKKLHVSTSALQKVSCQRAQGFGCSYYDAAVHNI